MADSKTSWLSLTSSRLSARIDPLGAQLSELQDATGRDWLWNGDAAVWTGRAPLLFPIVGALAGGHYRLASRRYALPRHGFAREKIFQTIDAGASSATFRLTASAATRQVYPFDFELDVCFSLIDATLNVKATVRNTGHGDLPASVGFHPAFRWPLPDGEDRAAHFIEFPQDEPAPIRRLGADGLLRADLHPTPVTGRRLLLSDALFRDDVIIFDALASRSVTYGAAAGPQLKLTFPDARYLGLWTKVGAGFMCIEPWQGIADPQGFTGDFADKPGIFSVAPGAERHLTMAISLA